MSSPKSNNSISTSDFIVYGKNSVFEALNSENTISKIWIADSNDKRLADIEKLARTKKVPVIICDKQKLKAITGTHEHRSIAAEVSPVNLYDEKFLENESYFDPRSKKEKALSKLLIPVNIQDPHNLGAIIRSAYAFGFDAVIISNRHSSQITSTVMSSSAGAALKLPIVRIGNISQVMEKLKKNNFWTYGADTGEGSQDFTELKFDSKTVLLMGSEGEGIPEKIREHCDFIVQIPMEFESLNVSVATGVLLNKIYQDSKKGALH